MKKLLLSALFLFGVGLAYAQIGPAVTIQEIKTDPTGQTCSSNRVNLKTPDGKIYTCQNGTMALVPESGGGCSIASTNGVCTSTITLSEADILSLDSSPFTIVPAAGSNTVVFPMALRWKYTFGTIPYTIYGEGNGPSLFWGDVTNARGELLFGDADAQPDLSGSTTTANYSSGMYPQVNTPQAPSTYDNSPIVLQNDDVVFNAGPLLSATVSDPGTLYTTGDLVQITTGTNPVLQVVATGGAVTSLIVVDPNTSPGIGPLTTSNVGNITSATVYLYSGNGYSNGDTGTVSGCGDGTAIYVVASSSGGNVQTVTISGGSTYTVQAACTTTPTSGTGDANLELDITSLLGDSAATANVSGWGNGYSNGDVGSINCGNFAAQYTVLTSSMGNVLTVSASGGAGYIVGPCATDVITGGGDGSLALSVVAAGGDGMLTVNPIVQTGDGTFLITTWYTTGPL